MHIDVLEEDTLVRVGWVDVWVSLYWEDAYRTMGRFTLEVRPTPENLSLLREGRWLKRSDSDLPMRICDRSQQDQDAPFVCSGFAATWLLDPRAPKVEMPPELKERIARMKAEAKKIEEAE